MIIAAWGEAAQNAPGAPPVARRATNRPPGVLGYTPDQPSGANVGQSGSPAIDAWLSLDDEVAANLADLLACSTGAALKIAWLVLTEDERRQLRSSQQLAQHARAVLGVSGR